MRHGKTSKQSLASTIRWAALCFFAATCTAACTARAIAAEEAAAPLGAYLEGLAESVQALADGDPARGEIAARGALAAIPGGEPAARATLTLALALRDQGRFEEAAQTLARALTALRDPALVVQARFERAQALFYSGHAGAAAVAFAELASSGDGPIARRARWREADALLEAGDAAGAVGAYQALLARDPTAPEASAARLSLARALRGSGDDARAVATYRAVWTDLPADPAGRAAARALRAWRSAGGAVPPPSVEQRIARATAFLQLALPRRALKTLDRLDGTSPAAEPASRSFLLRALALLQLGHRDEARRLAVRIQQSPAADAGTRTGAELVLARVAARRGDVDEAAARYRTIATSRERVPGLAPRQARDLPEDARFLAAWLYYDVGRFERAAKVLHSYLKASPTAPHADDARWFEAWSLHRLGRDAEAVHALSRLDRGPLAAAALYWQARLGRGARAQALYRRVLREAAPGSWYALLAAGRLAAPDDAPAPLATAASMPIPDGPEAPDASDPLVRAARLLGTGLRGEAIAELRALAATRGVHASAALVAQLAQAAGDSELPFRMARDHLKPSRRVLRWLYPRAFSDVLQRSARDAGCDPEIYLAIMRRESAFRPDARSGAGAIGLVQLIPPTAERIAAVQGVPMSTVLRLDLPEVSIPLGAAYLSLLTERFREPAAVIAAYNAGPVAVGSWARDRAGMALDEWVENIPFRETRRYVKNVMADSVVYRALWRDGALAVDGRRRVAAPREGVAF